MNDNDIGVVARNVILLLITFVIDDIDEAVECLIHIWYSAKITQAHLDILDKKIRPLISEMCEVFRIVSEKENGHWTKAWEFGERSLKVQLSSSEWIQVLDYMRVPVGLSIQQADTIRRNTSLAADRVDFVEYLLDQHTPSERLTRSRYREDGMLLPFGHSRSTFTIPNP